LCVTIEAGRLEGYAACGADGLSPARPVGVEVGACRNPTMRSKAETLDQELLPVIARHSDRPVGELHPWTHVVFDLGIDAEDIDDLVGDIERTFDFAATDAEWRSPSTLGDLDAMVKRLRGQRRPEVLLERERNAATLKRRGRIIIAALIAWLMSGFGAYFVHRPTFVAWIAVTVCAAGSCAVRDAFRGARERRRWKRERLARYGV